MIRREQINGVKGVTFRRWSGSSLGVFRSLGRVVRIGVLPLVYTLVSFGQVAYGQLVRPEQEVSYSIDSVLVARERRVAALAQSVPSVRIVSVDKLSAAGGKTLQEVLATIPGLDIRPRGASGIQADLQVRGGGFDQVMVLLNGVDLTDAQTGHHNLNIPIRPESIAYIEVLSGPGGRLFGPGAYAGAINIVTKQPEQVMGHLRANLASHGTRGGFASGGVRDGMATAYAYVSGESSNGFTRNSDYLVYDGLATVQLRPSWGVLDLQLGHQAKDFGANSFYTSKYPDQYEAIRSTVASLRYSRESGYWQQQVSFAYREHQDRFELFRDSAPSWYRGHNYHLTHLYNGRASLGYSRGGFTTTGALLVKHEEVLSTNLGTPAVGRHAIRGGGRGFYTHSGRRTHYTLSVEEQYRIRGFRIGGGGMATRNDAFGLAYGYGVDASYAWSLGWQAHASLNRAYRLPTFTDLYYGSPTRQGNGSLKPEAATTVEVGMGYITPGFSARLGSYYRMGRNVIDWVEERRGTGLFQAQNHAHVDAFGVEVSAVYNPHSRFVRSVSASYAYGLVYSPLGRRPRGGSYTFDHLLHSATLQGSFPLLSSLQLHAVARYEQRAGEYLDAQSKEAKLYPDPLLIDAKVEYGFAWCNLYVGVKNALDREVVGYAYVPQPGRIFEAGAEVKLGW